MAMLRVLADVDHVLAIAKPPGMSFHTQGQVPGLVQHLRTAQHEGQIAYGGR